jgi:thioredoxin reductase
MTSDFDVIVVGGGPAGLSGAVALGRALRSVLVVDAGEPRNAPADGIHNYLTRDSITLAAFAEAGRAEVRRYGGRIVDGRVVSAEPGFTVRLADGSAHSARRLLITTGLRDVLPDIPGLRERWGRTVLHCPYCHGYEARGRAIGVIGTSPMAVEQALLWRHWTDDLTLFQDTGFPDAGDERLAARGVTVVRTPVTAVGDDGVHLADGTVVARDALVVAARLTVDPLPGLGLKTTENPFGETVAAEDPTGRTGVPGVWVAGNVTDPMAQVISAAAAGLGAGAAINMDLLAEENAHAVADYRPSASSR